MSRRRIANQDADTITKSSEIALTKQALHGSERALDELLRRTHAIATGSTDAAPPPTIFEGRKQLAFEAVVQGHTRRAAAKIAGLNESTVYRYTQDKEWVRALRMVKAARVVAATRAVNDLLPLSIQRLRAVLTDPSASRRDVLKAAEMVLDRAGMPKAERHEVLQTVEARVVTVPADAVADLDAAMAGGGADE